MLAVRQKNTRPEMLVRSELHRMGARYRVHAAPLPGLRITADIDIRYWPTCGETNEPTEYCVKRVGM